MKGDHTIVVSIAFILVAAGLYLLLTRAAGVS